MKLKLERIDTAWSTLVKQHPAIAWGLSIAGLLLLGGIAFLWNLGTIGLVDETEPLFAEAARQMTVTGDWVTPYFNEATRFDKPPLVYWLMAIGYYVIGTNEWAVRLPSALSAIALMGLTFYVLHRYTPSQSVSIPWLSAGLGASAIALNPLSVIWGRTGVSDMLLVGCMGSALLAFFLGYATNRTEAPRFPSRWYWAFYVLVALAILAKGPVGIVLPGLIVLAFALYLGNLGQLWREMRPLLGLLAIAAISLPWYVAVILANGRDYIDTFFGYHNFERFTQVVNHHAGPWYFYFPVVLAGFAPWSVFVPMALSRVRIWQRKEWQATPRSRQLGLFAFFWFAVIFIFFTAAATKLPSYVLPLIPAGAISIALLASAEFSNSPPARIPMQLTRWANVALFVALGIAIYSLPRWLGYDPAAPDLNEALKASKLPLIGGIVWGLAAVAGIGALLTRRKSWLWGINLVGFLAFLILTIHPAYLLIDRHRQLPLRQIATTIDRLERSGEPIVMVGFEKPSLVFYTHETIAFFSNTERTMAYLIERSHNSSQPESVLLVGNPDRLEDIQEDLALQPSQYREIDERGAYQLVRVSTASPLNWAIDPEG